MHLAENDPTRPREWGDIGWVWRSGGQEWGFGAKRVISEGISSHSEYASQSQGILKLSSGKGRDMRHSRCRSDTHTQCEEGYSCLTYTHNHTHSALSHTFSLTLSHTHTHMHIYTFSHTHIILSHTFSHIHTSTHSHIH